MNIVNDLRAYSAQELLAMPFPPREFILEPWLRNEETAIIWSASGVGKTWMSLGIALAVAGGGRVGDWSAPKARRVIYFDGEMHQGDLQERIKFLLTSGAVAVPDQGLALRNIQIVPRQAQRIGADFIDLTVKEKHRDLIEMIRGKVDVVIFDNLTTMSDKLEDENSATDFKTIQKFFMEMKRAGVVAILIHHANKGGRELRGSTSLETTFEVILGLLKVTLAPVGKATFKTDFGKFRAKGDARLEQRTWSLGDDGWAISDAEPEDPKDDPIVQAVRSLRCTNQNEVAELTGRSKAYVSTRLKTLRKLGVVSHEDVQGCFMKARELRQELAEGDDEDPEEFRDAREYPF